MGQNSFFTKDFQIQLLTNLTKDIDLFESTTGYLKLNDFDMVPCRLILETLQSYYTRFHKLPDFNTLLLHINHIRKNIDGNTETILVPEDYEALSFVLSEIAKSTTLNTEYFMMQMPEYIRAVRVSRETAVYQNQLNLGQNIDNYVASILDINESIGKSGDIKIDNMDEHPESMMDRTTFSRIATGLQTLDKFTGGGLVQSRGEIGLIIACPGVGKTTALINFMHSAIVSGHRSIFFTLENPTQMIKWRFHGIAGGIPAHYFDDPVTQWPDNIVQRYNSILNPEYRYFGYNSIVDMSKRRFTLADLDNGIKRWKDSVDHQGKNVNTCRSVYVDWLDKLDPSGLSLTKTERQDQVLQYVTESMAEIARKHKVSLWTATQGTSAADGKEILRMKDAAWAYHKNDAVDVSIGIGEIANIDIANSSVKTDDAISTPPCSRDLMVSIVKNRTHPKAVFQMYQGETLRFWDETNRIENTVEKLLVENKYEQALGLNQSKLWKKA